MRKYTNRSKFAYIDRTGNVYYGFVPKRPDNIFEAKIPTYQQFFEDIKGLGHCKIVYKNRIIAYR